jgi:hypothetical protein
MIPVLSQFVDEVRAEHGHQCADDIEEGLGAIYDEGCDVPDAQTFLDAVVWIVKQPRSLDQRMEAVRKLASLEGRIRINLPRFLGWR